MSTLTLRGLVDQQGEFAPPPPAAGRPPMDVHPAFAGLVVPPPKPPGHEHRRKVNLSAEEAAGLFWWRNIAWNKRKHLAMLVMALEAGVDPAVAGAAYQRAAGEPVTEHVL